MRALCFILLLLLPAVTSETDSGTKTTVPAFDPFVKFQNGNPVEGAMVIAEGQTTGYIRPADGPTDARGGTVIYMHGTPRDTWLILACIPDYGGASGPYPNPVGSQEIHVYVVRGPCTF